MPKVSILIPTYNREETLARAVDSVLTQTFQDFEVVIIDNASSDGTQKIAVDYASQDKRIKFIPNKENLGPVRSWNKGLSSCSSEYIKILWSDDSIEPYFLEKAVQFLNKEDKLNAVFTQTIIVNGDDRRLNYDLSSSIINYQSYVLACMRGRVPVSPGCFLFRNLENKFKESFPDKELSEISLATGAGADMDFILQHCKGSIGFIAEPLSIFYNSPTSITSSKGKIVRKAYRKTLKFHKSHCSSFIFNCHFALTACEFYLKRSIKKILGKT